MSKVFEALERAEREQAGLSSRPKGKKPLPDDDSGESRLDGLVDLLETSHERDRLKKLSPWILVRSHPNSAFVEQIKKIRTHIHHCAGPTCPRVIVVTSAIAGEGKSLLSANLAFSIAQGIKDSVYLVDSDIRNPQIHKYFSLPQSPGLSDYLNGEAKLPQIIHSRGIERMRFLPAGKRKKNPIELISTTKMGGLLTELRKLEGDPFIILDSTPILQTSESTILSKMADGIIFVIRQNMTPRNAVKDALTVLGGERIIGLVLNDI